MNIARFSALSSQYCGQTRSAEKKNTSVAAESVKNQQTEQADSAPKVENNTSLPDKVFENIQKMAKEDAPKNIYMTDKFGAYSKSTMEKYVSPNRSRLMGIFNPMIANAQYTNGLATFFRVPGLSSFNARFQVGAMFGASVQIFDSSGQEVLTYSAATGLWQPTTTKAESIWMDDATSVYAEAYDAARAEINAQEALKTGGGAGAAKATGFNRTV